MSLTKKQQELRRTGVGASEIAALVGLSRYATPIQIWESKLGIGPDLDSYAADLGSELEEPIARVWAKRNARHLARVTTLRHPSHGVALATPDRAVYETREQRGDARVVRADVRDAERLLQVKSTNWRQRRFWGPDGSDFVPDEYFAQVQWEMAVAGVARTTIAVDFDKTQLHSYEIPAVPAIFEAYVEVAYRFWADHVEPRRPPPPDWTERYEEAMQRLHPAATTKQRDPVALSQEPEIAAALDVLARLGAARPRLAKLEQQARNVLVARIGDGLGLEGPWGRVSWGNVKGRTSTNWRAVAGELQQLAALAIQVLPDGEAKASATAQLRDVAERHTKTGEPTRRLYFSPKAGGDLDLAAKRVELLLDAVAEQMEGAQVSDVGDTTQDNSQDERGGES